jgi:hypothetical protein
MISPSKVGAIMRLSRWESQYSLWHRMRGDLPPEEPKDQFALGHDVEALARRRYRRRYPNWKLSPTEVQFVLDPDYFGFPAMVTLDARRSDGAARGVFEAKLARDQYDLEKWGDDLSGDLPADYWTQVLVAMIFTGWTKYPGHLICLGPNYKERIYSVEYNDAAQVEAEDIITQCREFWQSLAGDEAPELDESKPTYECIKALHPDIDGTAIEYDQDDALRYAHARVEFDAAEKALNLECNRIAATMGNARYAEFNGLQIARRQPHKSGVSFVPSKTITPERIIESTGEPS